MRVMIVFPGALGDLCLLAPALGAIVTEGADVEMSVQRSLMPVATMLLPTVRLGPPSDGALMATLFDGEPSAVLREWLQAGDRVHAWLARGNVDGSLARRLAALGVIAELHEVPRADGAFHVGDAYAAALGVSRPVSPPPAAPPAVTIPLPWRRRNSARLVVHPGAGARAKCWDPDGFRRVTDEWVAAGGEAIVLLGPAEEGDDAFWRAAGHEPHTDLSIAEAAALVASAPTWLGNDSGMSHLAGALGRRGVVLFGPTRPERWRPLGGDLAPVDFGRRAIAAVARRVLAILRSAPATP